MKSPFLIVFLFLLAFLDATSKDLKVLFIGNSLTYSNNLPDIVEELGKMDDQKISTKAITVGGYSLEDHWNEGRAQDEIKAGKYDFVILQQGPSALPESQVLLLAYAEKFAALCKEVNAKVILYMVWPSKGRYGDIDNVILSYSRAAEKTQSLLAPAGKAWKAALAENPALPLYSPDNLHPTITGTALASLCIYGILANKLNFDFLNFKTSSFSKGMTKSDFDVIKAVVEHTR